MYVPVRAVLDVTSRFRGRPCMVPNVLGSQAELIIRAWYYHWALECGKHGILTS